MKEGEEQCKEEEEEERFDAKERSAEEVSEHECPQQARVGHPSQPNSWFAPKSHLTRTDR